MFGVPSSIDDLNEAIREGKNFEKAIRYVDIIL